MKKNELEATAVSQWPFTDVAGLARRYDISTRSVRNLLSQGLPHLALSKRRIRIDVSAADAWMKARFSTQRFGTLPAPSYQRDATTEAA